MISSNDISQMMSAQQAMFGNFQFYSNQITPPLMRGVSGYGGASQNPYGVRPPQPLPNLPSYSTWGPGGQGLGGSMFGMMQGMFGGGMGNYATQAFGERLTSVGIGAANLGLSGLQTLNMGAGLASMAGGIMGMGGVGMGALGVMGGLPMMGGLAAGGWALNQVGAGFQQRQNVNQIMRSRFGGMMGVGGGSMGMGFSTREMGQMSTMLRDMGANDIFTNMDELSRVLDVTSQMGMYRGVQGAKDFRNKFLQITKSLKEIAQTMNTTMEGATQFLEQSKQLGYFSGKDINTNLMRARFGAGATGMSMDQVLQMQQVGTQMGRAWGMRGRQGAGAMREMGLNYAMGMQMGVLTSEEVAEATGGLTGAEGAQALSQRMMEANQRWLNRGPGQAMLAGLWNREGGIDTALLKSVRSGDVSIRELLARGRRNIAETGGRRSEFFLERGRLAGALQEAGGGNLMFGVLEDVLQSRRGMNLEDPLAKRFLQQQTGLNLPELEVELKQYRNEGRILRERANRENIQSKILARQKAQEGAGIGGLQLKLSDWWERFANKFKQVGDDLDTSVTEAVEQWRDSIEGRVKYVATERAEAAMKELYMFGEVSAANKGFVSSKDIQNVNLRTLKEGWFNKSTQTTAIGRFAEATGIFATGSAFGKFMGITSGETTYQQAERLGLVTRGALGEYREKVKDKGVRRAWTWRAGDLVSPERAVKLVGDYQQRAMLSAGELGVSEEQLASLGEAAKETIYNLYTGSYKTKSVTKAGARMTGGESDLYAGSLWGAGAVDVREVDPMEAASLAGGVGTEKRLEELRRNPLLKEAFDKLGGDRAKELALLRAIEDKSGISKSILKATIGRELGFAPGMDVRGWTQAGINAQRTYIYKKLVTGASSEDVKRIWENKDIQDKLLSWRFDQKDKSKALLALQEYALMNEDEFKQAMPGVDQSALKKLVTRLRSDEKQMTFMIGRLAVTDAAEMTNQQLLQEQSYAREMMTDLKTIQRDMPEEAANDLKAILDARANASSKEDIDKAVMKERDFIAKYGGDQKVIGALNATSSGATLASALSAAGEWSEAFRAVKGDKRTDLLITKTLGLYSPDLVIKNRADLKKISQRVRMGDIKGALALIATSTGQDLSKYGDIQKLLAIGREEVIDGKRVSVSDVELGQISRAVGGMELAGGRTVQREAAAQSAKEMEKYNEQIKALKETRDNTKSSADYLKQLTDKLVFEKDPDVNAKSAGKTAPAREPGQ